MPEFPAGLGYSFKQKALLDEALTHPSCALHASDPHFHYQRLEFLGDTVLALVLSARLYALFPHEDEGFLSRAKHLLVQRATLVRIAQSLDLAPHIHIGPKEPQSLRHQPSVLEDSIEAIVGAIFLDGGLASAQTVIEKWYGDLPALLEQTLAYENPKGLLQERCPPTPEHPVSVTYHLEAETGPDHHKQFTVSVSVYGKIMGSGTGMSKKEAELRAARTALESL